MIASCEQNAEENHNKNVANKSVENVTYLRCLRMAVTYRTCLPGVTGIRLNSGNAGQLLGRSFVFHLLTKNKTV
jgi:hypothetical protein